MEAGSVLKRGSSSPPREAQEATASIIHTLDEAQMCGALTEKPRERGQPEQPPEGSSVVVAPL